MFSTVADKKPFKHPKQLCEIKRICSKKRSHMLAVQAVKRLDGFYKKNENAHNFKCDNVQT